MRTLPVLSGKTSLMMLIGPSIGSELRRNALIALGIALLAQLAYLAFRFRWTFAVSAVARVSARPRMPAEI